MGPLKVLVVDDESDMRWLIGEVLRFSGVDITEASCAEEACEALDQNQFDVVISDIKMPGLDGYALATMLRDAALKTPLVAVAGTIDSAEAEKAGFVGTLEKPFSKEALLEVLAKATAKTSLN